jgi:hypothetical protein
MKFFITHSFEKIFVRVFKSLKSLHSQKFFVSIYVNSLFREESSLMFFPEVRQLSLQACETSLGQVRLRHSYSITVSTIGVTLMWFVSLSVSRDALTMFCCCCCCSCCSCKGCGSWNPECCSCTCGTAFFSL